MGNFKVKVHSEAESREVQELFVKLGAACGVREIKSRWVCLYNGQVTFYDFLPNVDFKEITLPELRAMVNDQHAEIEQVRQHRHYFIDVSDVDEIDFYEIALRYNVTDPCIQHILKKCLAVGQRGQKDFHHDLKDIYDTAKRMLAVHGLDS